MSRPLRILAIAALLAAGPGCGYHVAGRGDTLPNHIGTIAIPPFENLTTRYRLSRVLPRDIGREFVTRTRYDVITEEEAADAVLKGAVLDYQAYTTVIDPATGRASGMQIVVLLQVSLTDRKTGNLLYHQPRLELRERYEISVDQAAFFDESDAALERVSRDLSRSLVTAILEQF
jgi:hypothetical protein